MSPLALADLPPEQAAFVRAARHRLGRLPPLDEAFAFGDSPAMADALLALVLAGTKTATCGWPVDAGLGTPAARVQPGHWSVVLDGQGQPAAIIETLEVVARPFLEVDEQFAHDEGEGDRTLAWWQGEHRRAFCRRQSADGPDWDDGQTVQCERFRVVWPPAVQDA